MITGSYMNISNSSWRSAWSLWLHVGIMSNSTFIKSWDQKHSQEQGEKNYKVTMLQSQYQPCDTLLIHCLSQTKPTALESILDHAVIPVLGLGPCSCFTIKPKSMLLTQREATAMLLPIVMLQAHHEAWAILLTKCQRRTNTFPTVRLLCQCKACSSVRTVSIPVSIWSNAPVQVSG